MSEGSGEAMGGQSCESRSRIRVLIADDSEANLISLSHLLDLQPDIEVVGLARNGLEAIEGVKELFPDIIVMDVLMPSFYGLGAARRNERSLDDVRILFISGFADYKEESAVIGGDGFLTTPFEPEELYFLVRCIAE